MKRVKKMVTAGSLTQAILGKQMAPEVKRSLLNALPQTLFGKAIGAQVRAVEIEIPNIILRVPDPTWRKELYSRRFTILGQAQKIMPEIRAIQVIE